jgi:hypothetical protein
MERPQQPWYRKYSTIPRTLEGLQARGRRVFFLKSTLEEFRNDPTFGKDLKRSLESIAYESEGEKWCCIKVGECTSAPLLHTDAQLLSQIENCEVVALSEWYPDFNQLARSRIAELWLKYLRSPVIPYDKDIASDISVATSDTLRMHIQHWQTSLPKRKSSTDASQESCSDEIYGHVEFEDPDMN